MTYLNFSVKIDTCKISQFFICPIATGYLNIGTAMNAFGKCTSERPNDTVTLPIGVQEVLL